MSDRRRNMRGLWEENKAREREREKCSSRRLELWVLQSWTELWPSVIP